MEILRVENLSFTYPTEQAQALRGVSFSVKEGEFILLCGASGCGKTTLLRLLKEELAPEGTTDGAIYYKGKPFAEVTRRESAEEVGFVMQDPDSQIVTDKVWHELAFGLENLGLPRSAIRLRAAETAGFFGISDWFGDNTDELSGGQKQVLNLACVMAMHPALLLLDEPTGQLDPIAASEFIATVKKLNTELGLTVILAEHRLEELFPLADRVIVMENGAVVSDAKPCETPAALRRSGKGATVLPGLPAAMRIFDALETEGASPVTVKEGRDYLRTACRNETRSLPEKEEPAAGPVALELKNVCFRYEKTAPDVLRGLSAQIREGEIFAVLGGNGSGKTTMLDCLAGLRRPYAGSVSVYGKKIKDYKNNSLYRGMLSYLPQDPKTVFVQDSLEADLTALCAAMGKTTEESGAAVREQAARFGVEGLLARHPYDLSGGEQQKAALAKMLLSDPRILLMDEPTKGMDAAAKNGLMKTLRRLSGEGRTVVMVTHDIEFAAVCADRCAMLFDGEIFAEGAPRAFFSDNNFYTTAANRIARGFYDNAVTVEDVVTLALGNRQ